MAAFILLYYCLALPLEARLRREAFLGRLGVSSMWPTGEEVAKPFSDIVNCVVGDHRPIPFASVDAVVMGVLVAGTEDGPDVVVKGPDVEVDSPASGLDMSAEVSE